MARVTTPQSEIASATSRLEICRTNLSTLQERAERAHQQLGRAKAAARAAQARYDAAVLDDDARAMKSAQQQIEKSGRSLSSASDAAIEADNAVNAATRAAVDAEEALAASHRAKVIADLREACSVETYRAAVDPKARRILEMRAQILALAAEIDAAYAASRAASAELRSLGEPVPDLGGHHVWAPFLEATAEAHPERAEHFVSPYIASPPPPGAMLMNAEQGGILSLRAVVEPNDELARQLRTARSTPPERQAAALALLKAAHHGRSIQCAQRIVAERHGRRAERQSSNGSLPGVAFGTGPWGSNA